MDVLKTTRLILGNRNKLGIDLEAVDLHKLAADTSLDLDQVKTMCIKLTGDDYLLKMIHPDNPNGYPIYKVASSPMGVCVAEFVGFCAEELRVKALVDFFEGLYNSTILRERQGVKLRFEIASKGVTVSSVLPTLKNTRISSTLMSTGFPKLCLSRCSIGNSSSQLRCFFSHSHSDALLFLRVVFHPVAETEKMKTVDGQGKWRWRRILRITSSPQIAAAK